MPKTNRFLLTGTLARDPGPVVRPPEGPPFCRGLLEVEVPANCPYSSSTQEIVTLHRNATILATWKAGDRITARGYVVNGQVVATQILKAEPAPPLTKV